MIRCIDILTYFIFSLLQINSYKVIMLSLSFTSTLKFKRLKMLRRITLTFIDYCNISVSFNINSMHEFQFTDDDNLYLSSLNQ